MKALAKEVIGKAELGRMMSDKDVSKFSPMEIREAIQSLVTEGKDSLANALGDAGLSLYPDSEDILAITGLLALMRQDWAYAVDLMGQLHQLQGDKTPAFTYVMLVRALRCNLEPVRAAHVCTQALKQYPEQIELVSEGLLLEDFMSSAVVETNSEQ
jgi:uncharacterized protein HemY